MTSSPGTNPTFTDNSEREITLSLAENFETTNQGAQNQCR